MSVSSLAAHLLGRYTARTFFNRVSLKDEPAHFSISATDAEARAETALPALVSAALAQDLRFKKVDDSWTAKFFGGHRHEQNISYRAETARHVVEVVDQSPVNSGWTSGKGDYYSVERMIVIHEKDKNPEGKGMVFIRLSPTFAPSVNVVVGQCFGNAGLMTQHDGEKSQLAVDAATRLIHRVNVGVRAPEWVRDFKRDFKIVDQSVLLKAKRHLPSYRP